MPAPAQNNLQVVRLRFYTFNVETLHDKFELYAGTRKLKLLTPHDETSPSMIQFFTFPSLGAVVNFTTDETITAKGFKLGASVITIPSSK
jgi:hypothetical protein